jgi:hypothetical protein
VGLGFSLDPEHAKHDHMLGPHSPRKRPYPPTQHTLVPKILQQVKIAISSLNRSLMQHGSFVALLGKEVSTSDIIEGLEVQHA